MELLQSSLNAGNLAWAFPPENLKNMCFEVHFGILFGKIRRDKKQNKKTKNNAQSDPVDN